MKTFARLIGSGLLWSASCATPPAQPAPDLVTPGLSEAQEFMTQSGTVKVRVATVGSIAIKPCHAELCVPEFTPTPLRFAQIMTSSGREPPMPILAYVIEHPSGVYLVDTGELARFQNDPTYYACSPKHGETVRDLATISVREENELAALLDDAGIAPEDVKGIVLTHLHFDHTGGVPAFKNAKVYSSRSDVERDDLGWQPCRSLSDADFVFVDDEIKQKGAAGAQRANALGRSVELAPNLFAVQTPGHTPGALSVVLEGENQDLLFIGDTAFTPEMIKRDALAGIHTSLKQVRKQYEALRAYTEKMPSIVLPAHDPNALSRLQSKTPSSLKPAPGESK